MFGQFLWLTVYDNDIQRIIEWALDIFKISYVSILDLVFLDLFDFV